MNESSYKSRSEYLSWLYDLIGGKDGPCGEYLNLMDILLDIDFDWFVANDDNRAEDGLDLRNQFCSIFNLPLVINSKNDPFDISKDTPKCSVLEMMVALSIRIENDIMYESGVEDRTGLWFRQMIYNLGLISCTDSAWNADKHARAAQIVYDMVERRYDFSGNGGLFPLKTPYEDQRNVEIWKQMATYFYENSYQIPYQN